MKKNRRHRNHGLQGLALLLSIVLLFVFMPLSVIAETSEESLILDHECHSYKEYESYLIDYCPPENFIPFERISFFGEFARFKLYVSRLDFSPQYHYGYLYTVLDESGALISLCVTTEYTEIDPLETIAVDPSNAQDMRSLRGTEHADNDYQGMLSLSVGEVYYYYNNYKLLEYIMFYHGGVQYSLHGFQTEWSFYPQKGENSLTMRLLNSETAEAALQEIYARLDGTYKEPFSEWVQRPPALVGIGALGGAAIAAVATWLVTYFVMRKRRDVSAVTVLEIGAETEDTPPDQPTPPDTPPTP